MAALPLHCNGSTHYPSITRRGIRGTGGPSVDWHALPEGKSVGNGRGMASAQSYQKEMAHSSPIVHNDLFRSNPDKLIIFLDPALITSLAVGDPVDLKTGDNGMNTGWTVSAINQGLVRIAHNDTSEVREVPAGDLIYMPF